MATDKQTAIGMSLKEGDEVTVNEKCPYLADQSGVVTDLDDKYVTVRMWNNGQLNCFLPEELQVEQPKEEQPHG